MPAKCQIRFIPQAHPSIGIRSTLGRLCAAHEALHPEKFSSGRRSRPLRATGSLHRLYPPQIVALFNVNSSRILRFTIRCVPAAFFSGKLMFFAPLFVV